MTKDRENVKTDTPAFEAEEARFTPYTVYFKGVRVSNTRTLALIALLILALTVAVLIAT